MQTRMEKFVDFRPMPNIAPGGNQVFSWQLEGGDEECQIKRLVLSGGVHSNCTIEWALFQEPSPASADFTSEPNIAAFALASQAIIDRTTTIRVPRGWTLGCKIINQDIIATSAVVCTVLHYKVLS